MKTALSLFALAVATFAAGAATAQEKRRPASCQSIYNICMKRAGAGHAAICQDMYATAKANGEWPETQDEQGARRPPVPCTP